MIEIDVPALPIVPVLPRASLWAADRNDACRGRIARDSLKLPSNEPVVPVPSSSKVLWELAHHLGFARLPETIPMARTRDRATPTEVEAAIRRILKYHRLGLKNLKDIPTPVTFAKGAIDSRARQLQVNPTSLRKARQFAHPKKGYSQKQLDHLFRLLRKHRPQFGTTHIGILVTVPWTERRELQRTCIRENWSKSELEAEILKRLGPRRFGGRRRHLPDDPGRLLVQLQEMIESWMRWSKLADPTFVGDKQARCLLDSFASPLRAQVQSLFKSMNRLRDLVSQELEKARVKPLRADGS